MRMNKWMVLGMVGLAFAACSNEEDAAGGNLDSIGNGAVSVKIVKPTTKALTPDETVAVEGDIIVTLSNGGNYNESITIGTDDLATANSELTFWNVPSTTGLTLTASINGGKRTYADVSITSDVPNTQTKMWQVEPASVPAYGETSTFTKTGGTGSPNMANDGTTEEGAASGDENKEYDMYEATVTMAIPMARLEVGKITLNSSQNVYATLNYKGSYLDKYATFGGAYNNGAFEAFTSAFGNYWFEANAGAAGQSESKLKYAAAASHNFVTTPIEEGGLFNFYAGTTNPQFKLYFDDGTMKDDSQTNILFPRYAMITKYNTATQQDITLQNGHIYKITDVTLDPDNLIPDEEGNTMYGVTVTVVEAVWTVETLTGEWVSQ